MGFARQTTSSAKSFRPHHARDRSRFARGFATPEPDRSLAGAKRVGSMNTHTQGRIIEVNLMCSNFGTSASALALHSGPLVCAPRRESSEPTGPSNTKF